MLKKGSDVESVSDSSRYFVIKIKDSNSGRTAFIGIGFEDRGDSFDLNVALQDHFKHVEHEKAINEGKEDDTPKIDLSLKEGQTIKVNLNISKKSGASARPKPKAGLGGSIGLLPPPPSSSISNKQDNSPQVKSTSDQLVDILSFDTPTEEKRSTTEIFKDAFTDQALAEFDSLKLENTKPTSNAEDWSNFESYKPASSTHKKDNQDSFDQTSNWATF